MNVICWQNEVSQKNLTIFPKFFGFWENNRKKYFIGNFSYKLYTWLKRCRKYEFVGVNEYESNTICWPQGFLSSHDWETDQRADTAL